jgi:ABC-type Fe3+/spermidine/putrescine transport system ATPase subunit
MVMNAPLVEEHHLVIRAVTKRCGSFTALQDADLDIDKGEFVSSKALRP